MKHKQISAQRVVVTSFLVDLSDVVLNLVVAVLSGSVVILTEALQGFADLLTSGLLWVGIRRSRRRADRQHQFGFGKEIFFWILMAGVSMLVLTSGFALYFGFQRLFHPQPIHNVGLALVVLSIGLCTNVYALQLSLKRLGVTMQADLGVVWAGVRQSMLIETKATTILDLMGTVASVLGLVSVWTYVLTGETRVDGLGAIVIGLMVGLFAMLLIFEVKDFIVGRSAAPEVELRIRSVAENVHGIHGVLDLRTMQMGSDKVLVNMEVHVDHRLGTPEIERLMDDLKDAVRVDVPQVQHIQVEVETPEPGVLERDAVASTAEFTKKFGFSGPL